MKGDCSPLKSNNMKQQIHTWIQKLVNQYMKLIQVLPSTERQILELMKEHNNYRKQLVVVRDVEIPTQILNEFSDLRALLVIKVDAGLAKIEGKIMELLHNWTSRCNEIECCVDGYNNFLNQTSKRHFERERSVCDKENEIESFIQPVDQNSNPNILIEATPSSFSPVDWLCHFSSLHESVRKDCTYWGSILRFVFDKPIDDKFSDEFVPDSLESLQKLRSSDCLFNAYLEFNGQ